MRTVIVALLVALGSHGCSKEEGTKASEPAAPMPADRAPAAPSSGRMGELGPARIGAPAPDFELPSLDGGKVKLSDHKGKIVVLEWFNPDCPFVKKSHLEGSLRGLGARIVSDGVVWLAINSASSGKQGHGDEANREGKERYGIGYPILLDGEGKVGRAYGAERTPHMYVIDAQGVLVYRGAIDNSGGGDLDDATPKLINYVSDALEAVREKRRPTQAETKAWGCSVKYAN